MLRVNISIYFDLASAAQNLISILEKDKVQGHVLYFALEGMKESIRKFRDSNDGFVVAKRSASDLTLSIDDLILNNFCSPEDNNRLNFAKFDEEFEYIRYFYLKEKIDKFRHIFSEEVFDLDIYAVEHVGIYNTRKIVDSSSDRISVPDKYLLPNDCIREYDNAGRCLAFGLYTACGFHSLRALEVMLEKYFKFLRPGQKKPANWGFYIRSFNEMKSESGGLVPSERIIFLIDNIRKIDRNPIMHTDASLCLDDAEVIFSLSAIVISEIAREIFKSDSRDMNFSR